MRILNFGSINIDYVYKVDSFVSPGETKQSQGNRIVNSGGKGFNQSTALAKAGVKVYHAGCISKTDFFLKSQLEELGVNTDFIKGEEIYTGHAIIQVDDAGQNCIILSKGANFCLTEEFVDEVLSHFEEGDILLLQNEINMCDTIINKAHDRGMYIVLNPSPINNELLTYPLEKIDCFILNEIEGEQLSGCHAIDDIPDRLIEKFPGSSFVLTLGEKGAIYRDSKHYARQDSYKVKVVDSTAAGDTFTGYYIASHLCQGLSVEEALDKASLAASISVSRNGAAVSIPFNSEVIQ